MNNPYSAVFRQKVDNYFGFDQSNALWHGARCRCLLLSPHDGRVYDRLSRNDLLLRRLLDVHFTEEDVKQFFASNRDFPWYDMYTRFPFMILLDLVKQ
ncbi:MAG: hypothetical protein R2867_41825 [Caldilineaceae bacterium]